MSWIMNVFVWLTNHIQYIYISSVAVGFLFCIGSHVHSSGEATSSGADIFDRSQNIAHARACSRAAAAGHQAKVGTGFSEGRPSCVLGGFAGWDCLGFKCRWTESCYDTTGRFGGWQRSQAAARLHLVSRLHHTFHVERHGKFGRAKCIGEAVSSRCRILQNNLWRRSWRYLLIPMGCFWVLRSGPWCSSTRITSKGNWAKVENALCTCFDCRKIQKNYLRSYGCVPSQARRQLFLRLLTPEPALAYELYLEPMGSGTGMGSIVTSLCTG